MSTAPDRARMSENETAFAILKEFLQTLKIMSYAIFLSIWRFLISPPRKSVEGEIVLVTGAGSGIGQRISMEFAKLGAILVLWDIDEEKNKKTMELIRGHSEGVKCYPYRCDVGNREEVYQTAKRVKGDVGDVGILVNNAGVVSGKKLIHTPDHLIQHTINVNLMAHFWTVKCFLPTMLRKNHGHIVNISSSTGLVGLNKLTDYSTSKFGVVGFTEVLTYEIFFSGNSGVHTTLVCPSFVKTGLFPGCKMRFPWLIPPLEIQPTVERIMQGILTNQHVVCIPRLIYFFVFLKSILPVEAFHEVIRFSGAATFMDNFKGGRSREIQNEANGSSSTNGTAETNCNHGNNSLLEPIQKQSSLNENSDDIPEIDTHNSSCVNGHFDLSSVSDEAGETKLLKRSRHDDNLSGAQE
ncbi:hypothetical protein FSP39_002222 [Pinctada imbricata]|uniref:Uncharacterized protein n=1 Tax=Pinctada imbricata TaxID=66713 RepID=A0AA88XKM6_PINIB|nr:hypothetical protein FSP39_002222 [Pinctada imbricata]